MEIYNEHLDETLISGILQNGLKYYIIPKAAYKEKRALLTVKYGSVDDTFIRGGGICKTPLGTAHFLEHKLFDNETGSAFETFSALGAYVNAYTSFNNTAYYFSCSENFGECLKTLFGFVSQPYFTEESVAKEMGIIEQEVIMYDDNPAWAAYFDMLSCLYESHPAKNGIAGTRESVRGVLLDTLYACHESFYVPSNTYLICSGGLSADDIEKTLETGGLFSAGNGRAETILPNESANVRCFKSVKKASVSRPVFQIGFKDTEYSISPAKAYAYKMTLDMLIGESSELRESLTEKGLADDSLSFDYVCGDKYGYALISGESPEPLNLLAVIVQKAREIQKNGFREADFERIKRKHMGRLIRGFNSIEAITAAAAEYAVKGFSLFDCYTCCSNVKIDLCNSILDGLIRDGGYAISVLEPISE